jgi:two-component system CheB/CheR fusion protein
MLIQEPRRNEKYCQTVLDLLPDQIWTARPDGRLDYVNQRVTDFFGHPAEAIVEDGWQTAVHPEDLPQTLRRWSVSLQTGQPYETEFRLRHHSGEYRWCIARALPFRDEHGCIVKWYGNNTDITDRKRAEEAVREADRQKDEFLATLAHELRNPLAPIRNGLHILRLSRHNPEFAGRALDMMERQLHHMVRLIDDLLDLSRLSQGKLELQKAAIELAAIVQHAVETSRPLIVQSSHELHLNFPPESILVEADLTRLAQVFANLLNNAAKYTDPGGRVTLTVERRNHEAVVRVQDNGIGIPAAMLDSVFDLFTQVDGSLEKSQGGLGIGLSLVKRLVEKHGGTVEARSEGHGKGSEFVVRLPVLGGSASKEQDASSQGAVIGAPAIRRVLVADDNADAAASLALLLEIMGHDVRTVQDGLEAVEAVAEFQPELILLDIGMPRLNGYDACRRIRAEWGCDMVIVALTGWGQDQDRQLSRAAGFDHHLVKPVDPVELKRLLEPLPKAAGGSV